MQCLSNRAGLGGVFFALLSLVTSPILGVSGAVQVSFKDLTHEGVTLHVDMTEGEEVSGVQFQLGSDVPIELIEEDMKKQFEHPVDPSYTWSDISFTWNCHYTTKVCLAFSLAGAKISRSGKVLRYIWRPTLGSVWLSESIVTGPDGEYDESTPTEENSVEIKRPVLSFDVVEPKYDVDRQSLEPYMIKWMFTDWSGGWSSEAEGSFEIVGVSDGGAVVTHSESGTNSWRIEGTFVQCTAGSNGNKQVCVYKVPERDQVGDLVKVYVADHNSGSEIRIVNAGQEVLDVRVPSPVPIPKVSLRFGSSASKNAYDEDDCNKCVGSSSVCCEKKNTEVIVEYLNFDGGVALGGFQFTISGDLKLLSDADPKESESHEDAILASVFDDLDFTVAVNAQQKTFLAFSMQGNAIPVSKEQWTPLLKIYFTRTLAAEALSFQDVVLSGTRGEQLNAIVHPIIEVKGCPDKDKDEDGNEVGDGFCDDVDDDCDCCLNLDDQAPLDPKAGCQDCGDIVNNDKIDILDVVRTVNVVWGIDNDYKDEQADANGDGVTDSGDTTAVVDLILNPPHDPPGYKQFPFCGQ